MRQTCVPCKVTRSTKLCGVRRSPETFARRTDFRVPETVISVVLGTCDKEKLIVCKVLALFKLVPVKNDYFLHRKFELHRYQLMNGFLLYWHRFYWRKYGEYFSHELIFRLIPTWVWYDLLTVSQIWPPDLTIWLANRQLSYFF